MKKHHRVSVVLIVLLLIAAAVLSLYMYAHRDDWLGKKQALRIAVHDAGTSEGLIYDTSTSFGFTEDDIPVFEVIFTDHTAQYWYLIDAQSGEILAKDKTET